MDFNRPELRLHGAALQHLQSAFHQRHGLREIERSGTDTLSTLRPIARAHYRRLASLLLARRTVASLATVLRQQRFIAHEFVAVLLEDGAGECLAPHHEHGLAIFLQLVDQRNKVAVAADNGERVHVRMGEGHLQRIQRQVDVAAVLVAARGRQPLDHLHGVFGHGAGRAFLASPVGICELGHQVAPFLERVKRERYIKFPP